MATCQNIGKTLLSLFSAFKKEELCQLYIYPSKPDIKFCNSYFRVTDKDIFASYFKFKVNGRAILESEIIEENHELFEKKKDEKLYSNIKNKTAFRKIARDIMWKCSYWYNKALKNWLKKENPTCIFLAPGTSKFIFDIALKISKELKIPIISYISDDYYFIPREKSFLKNFQLNGLKRKIAQTIKKSSFVVGICDEISQKYFAKFFVPCQTIMTGSNYSLSPKIKKYQNLKTITYMGNLRPNRFVSLVEIGQMLDSINSEQNTNYQLNIYTGEKNSTILKSFDNINSVNLCGYVSGEEFYNIFHSADILLHTEAFDEKSIALVKNSISTKIADSLASGIPLFAYGPKDIASMQHLIKNDCAVCATNKKELKEKLILLFNESEKIKPIVNNAINTAKNFHDSKSASDRLYTILNSF